MKTFKIKYSYVLSLIISIVLVFIFQNCSGKKVYDYATDSSSQGSTTTSQNNSPQQEVCSIKASSEIADVGQSVVWTVSMTQSLPSGFKVLWKRQAYDFHHINVETSSELNSNLQKSETFKEITSEISYSAELQTSNGALICATNTVPVTLVQTTFSVDAITVSRDFVVPSGVTQLKVTAIGGGGGGGAGHFNIGAGGGGGGGGKVEQSLVTVQPGQTVFVTVGAAGVGGRYASSRSLGTAYNGTAGGTSSFGSLVVAKGGSGGFAGQSSVGFGKGGTGGGSGGGPGSGNPLGVGGGNGGKAGAASSGPAERQGAGLGWNFSSAFTKSILSAGDGGICANSSTLLDGGGGAGGLNTGTTIKASDGLTGGASPGVPGKGGVGYGAGGGGGSGTLGVGGAGSPGIVYIEWL
jgi:hypothetical protein